ncbi:DEAD/DEAH box helicase [Metabacillus sp. Hm71]|uniref:DEAD/DEAH box helicase n=1 Tax=Metabacillus sp. Hm71 TaxID=3450743 RepID=UPI003F41D73E
MRFLLHHHSLTPVLSRQKGLPIGRLYPLLQNPLQHDFDYSIQLQHYLFGRELLHSELPFSIELLHTHYQKGFIQLNHGVTRKKDRLLCNRCGNDKPAYFAYFSCARCGEAQCHYCRNCIMMGRVSECTPLYRWVGPAPEGKAAASLEWDGVLSKGQAHASEQVADAIRHHQELLVWAVCGAGKTEVLFSGIEYGLKNGKKICIATPRTDVVLELAPRLKKVFPTVDITALYGGSEERNKPASLYLSTTHQLLRFKEAFDAIIVDEVDAFPYSADKSLQYAVEKSRKPVSSLIYLTATPSKRWKREVEQNKRKAVKIPARYHGHPLPVPAFKWCGDWRKKVKKGTLPTVILKWISAQLQSKKQAFLFVPSISIIDQVVQICQKFDGRIIGVHAEDPERKEKVKSFRIGDIPIIVTSTILERGVTIPNSDVAVLGSEDDIFTESALVQISGRVGRSAAYPTGDIILFHFGKTQAMLDAKRHIQNMNEAARRSDLLTKN